MKKIYLSTLILAVNLMFSACANAQETKYVKVKEAPADWSGTYLIVYEDDENNQALVMNGALDELDVVNNYLATPNDYQTINGEDVRTINATDEVNGATFTISKSNTEGCYYIVSASGCGIGYNKFDTDPETGEPIEEANMSCKNGKTYDNTIAMQEGKTNVVITAKVGYELRFNTDAGKTRFRYYAPGKKKAVKLYRKEVVAADGTIITGVSKPKAQTDTQTIYNLQGQQITKAQKGVKIINGKKTL